MALPLRLVRRQFTRLLWAPMVVKSPTTSEATVADACPEQAVNDESTEGLSLTRKPLRQLKATLQDVIDSRGRERNDHASGAMSRQIEFIIY